MWVGQLWFLSFVNAQAVKAYDAATTQDASPELLPRVLYPALDRLRHPVGGTRGAQGGGDDDVTDTACGIVVRSRSDHVGPIALHSYRRRVGDGDGRQCLAAHLAQSTAD